MIKLDCSYGEGGGQVLRTALALSVITNKPFYAFNIRKNRKEPGLKSQHLHCIKGLKKLCNAKASDANIGSTELEFVPGEIKGGTVEIDIGTAGSISLLMQSLLLPAIFAKKKTRFRIKGGTSGKWAMPFDFFKEVLIPNISDYADINASILQRGYYPHGGGKVSVEVIPKKDKIFAPLNIINQGKLMQIKGISHASIDLQKSEVAERQARTAKLLLSKYDCPVNIQPEYTSTLSTGSGITLWAIFQSEQDGKEKYLRLGSDALGAKGKSAEKVGTEVAEKLISEIDSTTPIDSYTADNLIPFLAIFGGKIRIENITPHTKTNIWTSQQFINKKFFKEGNIIICRKE